MPAASLLVSIEAYVLLTAYVLITIGLAKLGARLVVRVVNRPALRWSSSLVGFVGSLLRGLIWAVAAVFVITEASVTFGLEQVIPQSISSFLSANKIVNYSAMPKLIVHYEVTIGYDVLHRLVEKLLLDSAGVTEGVNSNPLRLS